jgi:phage protein D
MKTPEPKFKIKYAGKEITTDLSGYLIEVTYTDAEEGESDEITFTLADPEGIWRDAWYPKKGDAMELEIGYDAKLMPCGRFEIDELKLRGNASGDTVEIRALAAGIKKSIRTKRSTAHEKQTLRQIAEKIASANGLSVQGDIPNVQIERVTQNQQTDLAFLRRVAGEYGCMFSIRDSKLIFTSIFEVEKSKEVLEIDRTELLEYDVTDKAVQTYKKAEVRYANSANKKVVKGDASSGGKADAGAAIGGDKEQNTSDDVLAIRTKAENEQQANLKAQAALHRANSHEQEARFSVIGEPRLVAGVNVTITGLGKLSGKYHVTKSTHRIGRTTGYITEIETYRLKDVAKPEQRKPKRVAKKRNPMPKKGAGTIIGGGVTPYSQNDLMTS